MFLENNPMKHIVIQKPPSLLPERYYVLVMGNINGDLTDNIYDWCQENCIGSWSGFYTAWSFSDKDDLLLFKLSWL